MIRHLFLVLVFLSTNSWAQSVFDIPKFNEKFSVRIYFDNCAALECEGPGRVELINTKTEESVAIFSSQYLDAYVDKEKENSALKVVTYEGTNSIAIDDFNFDGFDDVAIRDGSDASYGYPSYTVYLYDPDLKKYVENADLSRLTGGEYLGMFRVDHKRKRLINYNKGGDADFYTYEFTSSSKDGLQEVCKKTESRDHGEWNEAKDTWNPDIVEVWIEKTSGKKRTVHKKKFLAEKYNDGRLGWSYRCDSFAIRKAPIY